MAKTNEVLSEPKPSETDKILQDIADLKKVLLEQTTIIKRLIQGYRPR